VWRKDRTLFWIPRTALLLAPATMHSCWCVCGPQTVLDPSNIRPVLITLGIACVLGALLYFTNNIAVSEAMERRRLMYSRTGSFVPPVSLPDAPKDVRHRAVDGRPPSGSAITNLNASSTDGEGPARYDLGHAPSP
jgi:hypothetical protein